MSDSSTAAPPRRHFLIEWWLLGSALLLLGVGIAAWQFSAHREIERHEGERLALQAQVVDTNLSHQLDAVNHVLLTLIDDWTTPHAGKDHRERLNHLIHLLVDSMPIMQALLIVDAEGTVFAANHDELIGTNLRERGYFKAALSNPRRETLYVGPPFKTALGTTAMSLSRMVPDAQGGFAGVIVATVDPEELWMMLEAVRYAPDMRVGISHGNGQIIMEAPQHPEMVGKSLAAPGTFFSRHVASGLRGNLFSGNMHTTGEARLAALRTVQPADLFVDQGLIIAVTRDADLLYAAWRQQSYALAGLYVALLLIGVISLYFFQRRAARAERQAAAAIRQLQEKSAELAHFFDLELILLCIAGFDGRFHKINAGWQRVLGHDMAALEQTKFLDHVHPKDQAATRDALAALSAGKSLSAFTNRYRAVSGEYRYIEWFAVPYMGRLIYAAAHDVTELKQAQLKLEQTNDELKLRSGQAEAASRAKTAFLANMSHEIRTPMNAILGFTHILKRGNPDSRQVGHLDKIIGAAEHLLALINDILDLSKIEAGKLVLEQIDFSLRDILDQVRTLIADTADAKGLALEMGCDDMPAWLCGDPTRLRQALLNLLGNAIKFTPQGQVSLYVSRLPAPAEEVLLRFDVRDSGIGIAPEKLSSLFRAFEQADVSTTRHYGGTGLGLTITQRLAALMGGETGAESQPGKGSRFWFTARFRLGLPALPRAAAEDHEAAADAAETDLRLNYRGARLLLAEDDAINQEVVIAMLANCGLELDLAEDGRQALAMAGSQAYELILMDVQMPQLDGLEATRAIRQLAAHRQTPILAMTANASSEDRERCLAAGMSDHLGKPVDPLRLYQALLQWLPRRLAGTPAQLPPAAADPRRSAMALQTLATLLGNDDPLAEREFLQHLPLLRDSLTPATLTQLERQVAAFDFPAALRTVQSVQSVQSLQSVKSVKSAQSTLTDHPPEDPPQTTLP